MRAARLAFAIGTLAVAAAGQAVEGEWSHQGRHAGVTLGVMPLTAQWRSAFYVNRGFPAEVIQPYAAACGLSFGLRNAGEAPVDARLADWRAVGADGQQIPLPLPETWEAQWAAAGVPQPARIAFRWAQFQSESHFEPGDWIMGMATLSAVPAAPFRLIARYRDAGGEHEIVVDKLACAAN
jgi:hypothetical protein